MRIPAETLQPGDKFRLPPRYPLSGTATVATVDIDSCYTSYGRDWVGVQIEHAGSRIAISLRAGDTVDVTNRILASTKAGKWARNLLTQKPKRKRLVPPPNPIKPKRRRLVSG